MKQFWVPTVPLCVALPGGMSIPMPEILSRPDMFSAEIETGEWIAATVL